MKFKTKVAQYLRKWADKWDPEFSFDYSIPYQPIETRPYKIEELNLKLTYSMMEYQLRSGLDQIVRMDMASKIAESLVTSPALSIEKREFCHNMEYTGTLQVLFPS